MSFNATRLTCFALLSAIETDLREITLAADSANEVHLPPQVESAARARARRDQVSDSAPLAILIEYIDFADAYQILKRRASDLNPRLSEALSALQSGLERLTSVRNRVAHSRPMEVGDLAIVRDLAIELSTTDTLEWPATTSTLDRLRSEPSYVLGLTVKLPADPISQIQNNLPVPDFDETGFYGRSAELKRIKKALLGPYPVISILGDGGIGKTAIALKVAYDLLDSADLSYDAIVWASAKSSTLTNRTISGISGAIQDSLGMFEMARRELAGEALSLTDPMGELLEYLEQFRVLLILDNLETVTDSRIREFLLELPLGSKVLLTSRIGLGIENPVKLDPLSGEESKRLLKSLAKTRGVGSLLNMTDESATKLAKNLKGHPLYIKWFVAGVQSGRSPSELVRDNSLLLDYCMSNVWDKLSAPARDLLLTMFVAEGPRTMAELSYLTNKTAEETQNAILDLMTTNFASMRRLGDGRLEGAFELGDFAHHYIGRSHAPSISARTKTIGRVTDLESIGRDYIAASRLDPYDPSIIDVRDRVDVPIARVLNLALRELHSGDLEASRQYCSEAQALSSTYGEVWRVLGLVHVARRDISLADEAFRTAVELAPDSAVMAFHYANFLANDASRPEQAVVAISGSLKSDPRNFVLLNSLAVFLFHAGKYREAVAACGRSASIPQPNASAADNSTLCLRAAVFGTELTLRKDEYSLAAEILEDAAAALSDVSAGEASGLHADLLRRLVHNSDWLQGELADGDYLAKQARELQKSFSALARTLNPKADSRETGQVKTMDPAKLFGFIYDSDDDVFFHRNDLTDRRDWGQLGENSLVAYETELTPKGPKARRVRALF